MDRKSTDQNNGDLEKLVVQVLKRIKNRKGKLSTKQQNFADFVIRNPEKMGFLSIMEAAQEAGVSQTTIFRFCKELGYDGYAQFTREIQQALQAKMTVTKTFQLALTHFEGKEKPQSLFESVIKQEIQNITNLSKSIQKEDYYRCIDLMSKADRIVVVGFMASVPLVMHFGNMLSRINLKVDVLCDHGIMSAASLSKLTKKSIVILIAFPRYPRNTVEIGKFASEKGSHIISITNIHTSPVVSFSDIAFIVPLIFRSAVDPYAAPITLITALATELSRQTPKRSKKGLALYDSYVSEFKLFI